VGNAVPGGLPFPFALQSTVPFTIQDGLALAAGTGGFTVTQQLDETVPLTIDVLSFDLGVGGQITVSSTDTFPTSPLLDTCIALTSN